MPPRPKGGKRRVPLRTPSPSPERSPSPPRSPERTPSPSPSRPNRPANKKTKAGKEKKKDKTKRPAQPRGKEQNLRKKRKVGTSSAPPPPASPVAPVNEREEVSQSPLNSRTSIHLPSPVADPMVQPTGPRSIPDTPAGPSSSQPPPVDEEVVEPMRPLGYVFNPRDYGKKCRLSTKCTLHKFKKNVMSILSDTERSWFLNHPQFKHLFHMTTYATRKVMGLWMLLLRTAKTDKKNQAWFVVNGVPIRYSIREHALLTGLYCHEYPGDLPRLGSTRFADNHFKATDKITPQFVLRCVQRMNYSPGRLKMAVLYFLATVIKGKSKHKLEIDPFLVRIVEDLDLCKTFPWGRSTFEDNIFEIGHVGRHFRGSIPDDATWTFPGFINGLEILAFECIPTLRTEFRVKRRGVGNDCPRMCRWEFTETGTTGYSLGYIYDHLRETKDITSILNAEGGEVDLIARVMEETQREDFELKDDSDVADPIVDGWNKFIIRQQGKILWEDVFMADVQSRDVQVEGVQEEEEDVQEEDVYEEAGEIGEPPEQQPEAVRVPIADQMKRMMNLMEEGFKEIKGMIQGLDTRMVAVESFVEEQRNPRDFDFEFGGFSGPIYGDAEARDKADAEAREKADAEAREKADAAAEKEMEERAAAAEKENAARATAAEKEMEERAAAAEKENAARAAAAEKEMEDRAAAAEKEMLEAAESVENVAAESAAAEVVVGAVEKALDEILSGMTPTKVTTVGRRSLHKQAAKSLIKRLKKMKTPLPERKLRRSSRLVKNV